jgi:hypothetical protein
MNNVSKTARTMPLRHKYRIPDRDTYRRLYKLDLETVARCRQNADGGSGLNHWNLSSWVRASLAAAGSALAFDLGDGVVAGHFTDSLVASRLWLASGRAWQPKPQAVDPKVTITRAGDLTFEITEMPRRMAEIGWVEDWEIGAFETALLVFLAFGTRADVVQAAEKPEVAYRSPDILADPASFVWVRALKAWGLQRMDEARAACREVLECGVPPFRRAIADGLMAGRPIRCAESRAMLAMLDGRHDAFAGTFAALEAEFTKFNMGLRKTGMRFYSLPALTLARMAKSYGIETVETALVPSRFLPGPLEPPC